MTSLELMLLSDERDQKPKLVKKSFEELAELLSFPRETDCDHSKLGKNKCSQRIGPAWCPGISNGARGSSAVIGMDVLVFDLDHLTDTQEREFIEAIRNVRSIWHTTHSHVTAEDGRVQDGCYRVVIGLSRRLSFSEIKPVREAVIKRFNLPVDRATSDEGRIYFLPSHSKNDIFSCCSSMAEPLDVDAFKLSEPSLPVQLQKSNELEVYKFFEVGPLRDEAVRRARPELKSLVRRAMSGERLADVGQRDSQLNQLCSSLGFSLAGVPIDVILGLIEQSVNAMDPPESGTWMDLAREKLTRSIKRFEKARAEKQQVMDASSLTLRKEAAAASKLEESDVSGPYPTELIEKWAQEQGTDREGFQRRWVIQHGGGYFFFDGGRYRTVLGRDDAEVSMFRDLSRAPVELYDTDKSGNKKPRSLKAVVLDYGTVARKIRSSLVLQESHYDAALQEFHEAVCPLRKLTPTFDPEIDTFLRIFGGAQEEKFLDWCAMVPDLQFFLCALYMRGEKNTGKTLFAQSLSRLWTTGSPSKLTDALAPFNDTLTRNPFCFADEQLPKTDTIINDLREFIGNGDRALNRKFLATTSLQGAVRLFIAANNDGLLADARASVTQSDVKALVDRIFFVDHGDGPTKFLENLLVTKGVQYIDTFKSQDRVAKHILWLAENRKFTRVGRYGVRGEQTDFHEQLVTDIESVSNVLEFIVRHMCHRTYTPSANLLVGNGRLLVNTELVATKENWEKFITSRKTPTAKQAHQALSALSEEKPVCIDGIQFSALKVDLVLRWAERRQIGNVEKLKTLISRVL